MLLLSKSSQCTIGTTHLLIVSDAPLVESEGGAADRQELLFFLVLHVLSSNHFSLSRLQTVAQNDTSLKALRKKRKVSGETVRDVGRNIT